MKLEGSEDPSGSMSFTIPRSFASSVGDPEFTSIFFRAVDEIDHVADMYQLVKKVGLRII